MIEETLDITTGDGEMEAFLSAPSAAVRIPRSSS